MKKSEEYKKLIQIRLKINYIKYTIRHQILYDNITYDNDYDSRQPGTQKKMFSVFCDCCGWCDT